MLPKVATTFLHSTSRAAAAVQNHAHSTFRNALNYQTSATAPGPSFFDQNGPSSSGKNTGSSRFQSGYYGASRAVTQANPVVAQDVTVWQTDDAEEVPTRRTEQVVAKKTRPRSSSISLTSRSGRVDRLGVLRALQIYARSKQLFDPTGNALARTITTSAEHQPKLVRRNSTASVESTVSVDDLPPPPRPRSPSVSSADATTLQAAFPTEALAADDSAVRHFTVHGANMLKAAESGDADAVAEAVAQFRQTAKSPMISEFNLAIDALLKTRSENEPLSLIMDTYNDLLGRGILPNFRTYLLLLKAFLARDAEVAYTIKGLQERLGWNEAEGVVSGISAEQRKTLSQLEAEGNFLSAVAVFKAIVTLRKAPEVPPSLFGSLMKACAENGDVDTATFVWSTVQAKTKLKPDAGMYRSLIQLHGSTGDLKRAEEAFSDFRAASRYGSVMWRDGTAEVHLVNQLLVWNAMIESSFLLNAPEKAIALLDEMMQSCKVPGTPVPFDGFHAPPPASSTFTLIIQGFLNQGDGATALKWFNRLLDEPVAATGAPFLPSSTPTRPDLMAWRITLDGLAKLGMVDEANALVKIHNERKLGSRELDKIAIRSVDLASLFNVNFATIAQLMQDIEANGAAIKERLDFVARYLIGEPPRGSRAALVSDGYVALGYNAEAVSLLSDIIKNALARRPETYRVEQMTHLNAAVQKAIQARVQDSPSLSEMFAITDLAAHCGVETERSSLSLLQAYQNLRMARIPLETISHPTWQALLRHAVAVENIDSPMAEAMVPGYAFEGTLSLLTDMGRAALDFDFVSMDKLSPLVSQLVQAVVQRHGEDHVRQFCQSVPNRSLGQVLSSHLSEEESVSESEVSSNDVSTAPTSPMFDATTVANTPLLTIDTNLSNRLDAHITGKVLSRSQLGPGIDQMMRMFEGAYAHGKVPSPYTIGRVCMALGRSGNPDAAKRVYGIAQDLLVNLEYDKELQQTSWFQLEDAMIVALSQSGCLEDAHLHRQRIIDQGGAPSADAYGSLILFVRDTTDDTSNAMALYQESQMLGVLPNQYLYNNIISKLAKARKADYALELFYDMKSRGINPSSVTYGALIGACSRVGDVESAERLFLEMSQEKSFKPRVPPFNTMMQLYTTTKPNRARALHYWDEMIKAGVRPSAYSYKLLMEGHVLEPCDMDSAVKVFNEVVQNPHVELLSTHFATLINAYGCVMKDLDAAIKVFDSIPTYGSKAPAIDALVYEAMMNVLIAHRRTDLIPEWTAKLAASGVHMTAYIVNVLIKGYAVTGDIGRARELFESLHDPAQGVAGMHNHAPHDTSSAKSINPMEPVYREPSTWESMVRAELGMGHRDRAQALLERLKERKYPQAVFNRISGIMVDHSMLPPQ